MGFTPIQLAWLFLLYELAGIVTNLAAGWLAARFGLAATLYAGLALQIAALVALAQLDPGWGVAASVAFVMAVQGVSGVAKDLAKMSSKSAVKLLAPARTAGCSAGSRALTGSKNAVKGLGFFLGAALLALAGFEAAVWGMAAVLAVILIAVVLFLPAGLPGRMKADEAWGGWRSTRPRVNRLSLARMFLFGARDVWFVVGVPVYFQAVLSDGTRRGAARGLLPDRRLPRALDHRLRRGAGGGPAHSGRRRASPRPRSPRKAIRWAGCWCPIPFALAAARLLAGAPVPLLTADAGRGAPRLRLRLRGQFLGPFLPDPRLRRGRPDHPRRRASTTWPMRPGG